MERGAWNGLFGFSWWVPAWRCTRRLLFFGVSVICLPLQPRGKWLSLLMQILHLVLPPSVYFCLFQTGNIKHMTSERTGSVWMENKRAFMTFLIRSRSFHTFFINPKVTDLDQNRPAGIRQGFVCRITLWKAKIRPSWTLKQQTGPVMCIQREMWYILLSFCLQFVRTTTKSGPNFRAYWQWMLVIDHSCHCFNLTLRLNFTQRPFVQWTHTKTTKSFTL